MGSDIWLNSPFNQPAVCVAAGPAASTRCCCDQPDLSAERLHLRAAAPPAGSSASP